MIEPTFKMTEMFFDRPAVEAAVAKAKKGNLTRQGGTVRKIARRSMRKRKKSSAAGQPPSVHSPDPNLRKIYYVWEPDSETVVVGPVKFRGRSGIRIDGQARTVPGLHERGGRAMLRQRRGGRRRGVIQNKQATFRPRPFMGLAEETAREKYPDMWENSVRP